MRKLNAMFHIEGEQLIKTSNNTVVPEDEPLFILRGRDKLAASTLIDYRYSCMSEGCDSTRLEELFTIIREFQDFATQHPDRMKQPGVTRGR